MNGIGSCVEECGIGYNDSNKKGICETVICENVDANANEEKCSHNCIYDIYDKKCHSSCINKNYYKKSETENKCILKECKEIELNSIGKTEDYRCGPGNCYVDLNNKDINGNEQCSEKCFMSDHFKEDLEKKICVLKKCNERKGNLSENVVCGSEGCYLDPSDEYSCKESCSNEFHYGGNNRGICTLLECEFRKGNGNDINPCGLGCVYDEGNTKTETQTETEEEKKCKKMCENDYNDENGICIKNKVVESSVKSNNLTGAVVSLSIIIGLCVIIIIVIVIMVYFKKKKKINNNEDSSIIYEEDNDDFENKDKNFEDNIDLKKVIHYSDKSSNSDSELNGEDHIISRSDSVKYESEVEKNSDYIDEKEYFTSSTEDCDVSNPLIRNDEIIEENNDNDELLKKNLINEGNDIKFIENEGNILFENIENKPKENHLLINEGDVDGDDHDCEPKNDSLF
jgi:hypothetical protein